MARIQILELPEGAGDDRPPFLLIIDEAGEATWNALRPPDGEGLHETLEEQTGARAVLLFEVAVEIPANEISLDPDGYPIRVKLRVEGDFGRFREQVQDEIAKSQAGLANALRTSRRI
ncbi:hypothetical protein [Streptomyces sp. H27-H5]|uniref:hypothetical protein n=1 Tax=Streptomyces sp. H27-H5 TaxID=2996460 RepID=UPI002270D66D|nr:hypothetical protein [Streptomyces sp. H27-H5]MCY0959976.1 hypothetical protein [Streptomyces sp. H27-H5]